MCSAYSWAGNNGAVFKGSRDQVRMPISEIDWPPAACLLIADNARRCIRDKDVQNCEDLMEAFQVTCYRAQCVRCGETRTRGGRTRGRGGEDGEERGTRMLMRLRRRKRSEKISIYGKKSKRTVIAALCYSARAVI
ncbi:unnamed protein product [Lota lota]